MQSFKTKKDCVEFLNSCNFLTKPTNDAKYWYETGTYVLRHDEYDRPDYIPVRYKDGWGIKAIYYYYSNTYNKREDGRVNVFDFEDGSYAISHNENCFQNC